jgi:molybdenum cofactor synthesis domain-containing protein
MRCEVVAVGTELLLGQIVDTNSSWIGDRLASAGIDSFFQTKVGDNIERLTAALRQALARSDAVVVCGGLGPTQDDLTRSALARVMGVELVRDPDLVELIRAMFSSRNRRMPANNLAQADVPEGATIIEQTRGTAPGLICPVRWEGPDGEPVEKVLYAVPGVPYEMQDMLERAVLPDLRRRAGDTGAIVSRTLRTWGDSESGLAERLTPRIDELDRTGTATLAFLASGIEGIKVRVTAKAATEQEALAVVEAEEAVLRDPAAFRPDVLMHLRRYLLDLRKSIFHEREILVRICRRDSPFVDEKSLFHFRDIYDHLAKFYELAEMYREMISNLMETYLSMVNNRMSQVANRMNKAMRRLTLITTIFMPLTLLAGIGGMSEWSMMTGPENWKIAYPAFILAMAAIGVVSYYILKRLEKFK